MQMRGTEEALNCVIAPAFTSQPDTSKVATANEILPTLLVLH